MQRFRCTKAGERETKSGGTNAFRGSPLAHPDFQTFYILYTFHFSNTYIERFIQYFQLSILVKIKR